ncbi:MAG: hypothetical protein DRN15_08830 [Thermoprotei archaeon]|nr:MAG: hypothetical protein DRN15_08830 [Thermoprotei archaeon]
MIEDSFRLCKLLRAYHSPLSLRGYLRFEICIFDRKKVAVIYMLDGGLRLHVMVLNSGESGMTEGLKLTRRG